MAELTKSRLAEMLELNAKLDEALACATRDDLLEHARMGRSVCEGRGNGQVVWVTPAEIFARYGLDENGKPIG